jgi:hypothetical protein
MGGAWCAAHEYTVLCACNDDDTTTTSKIITLLWQLHENLLHMVGDVCVNTVSCGVVWWSVVWCGVV